MCDFMVKQQQTSTILSRRRADDEGIISIRSQIHNSTHKCSHKIANKCLANTARNRNALKSRN